MRLLVTGGASGLGRAVALGAAERGAKVVVADIDKAGAESVAGSCGGQALAVDLIKNPEQAVDDGARILGGLDVLINNAGYGAGEAFLEMKSETWDRTLGLNVKAVALGCAAAGRIMVRQKSGRIINITSPASRMALPNYTAYAASKAAVDAITRAAAVALAPHGIRVNSVAPGMMDTPMQRVTEEELARIENRTDIDKFLAERTARIPVGRRIEPEEVAKMVLWLAFDAPDYITAERLNVSGGWTRTDADPQRTSAPTGRSRSCGSAPRRCAGTCCACRAPSARAIWRRASASRTRSRRSISTNCATTRPTWTGRSATASCSRPATIRLRSGPRSPRPA